MIKHFFLSLLFILSVAYLNAQSTISGKLTDKIDNSPLVGASIVLLNLPDSTIYKGVAADVNGNFLIESVAKGKYILKVTYVGYSAYIKALEASDAPLVLNTIPMNAAGKNLKDVVIEGKATTAIQKGDTTQYNASNYKTNPDANAEDLVTKMSGVTMQDGKVQAHGEEVKKVLVDGKPFFGDDPNAVLKNLPAEVIDKIQVFDQQSDQSKFTGVSDGNTTKTINIITKPGMKNGTFGRVFAGYGYEDVYKAGANINFFKGDRRISIISQSNNINEQNFSSEDLAGVMSSSQGGGGGGRGGHGGPGGMGMGGYGGGPGGYGGSNPSSNFLVNTKNGIAQTNAFGINYTDKWAKKVDVSASYFFNWADNTANQVTKRQYLPLSDSGFVYNENSINNSKNINHRVNLKMEWKLDTNNTISLTPKFSLQQNNGRSNLEGDNNIGSQLLNTTNSLYMSTTTAFNFSSELQFMHKFKKTGRTFSINASNALTGTEAASNLNSENTYYSDTSYYSSSIDQEASLLKKGQTYGANVAYTEPLGKKGVLQVSYINSFNFTENNKETYNFSTVNDSYSNLDTSLTNVFKSTYTTHKGGLSYRFNNEKIQFNLGANYQYAVLNADQQFPYNYTLNKEYYNILPTLMMKINFSSKKSLRIMYRTQTSQPSIDQLQNVLNNTNPTQLSIGNPDLKQNYENTVFMRYSSSNTEKGTSLFAMVAGTFTNNYIANSTYTAMQDTVLNGIALARGTQLTQPVNTNGYYNTRSFITYGFPLSFVKSNLNINANANFSKTPGLVNNRTNYSNSQGYGAGITLSSNISKDVDFSISTQANYTIVDNTINKQSNTTYYNQSSKLKLNLIFIKNFVLANELNHQYYKGLSAGYDQNYLLWNAGLGYKFLKDQKAEIRFSVNDILQQNTNITRNTTETYIEDVQTNLLQRYFMLTFTYNIKVFKKKAEDNKPKDKHE